MRSTSDVADEVVAEAAQDVERSRPQTMLHLTWVKRDLMGQGIEGATEAVECHGWHLRDGCLVINELDGDTRWIPLTALREWSA